MSQKIPYPEVRTINPLTGKFRAVIVCVNFSDILSLTLPYNIHHFSEVMVVTSKEDYDTQRLCNTLKVRVHSTNSFYHDNASFAKFRALEQALDSFGRSEWMTFVDADIFWPKTLPSMIMEAGNLYSFRRRRLLLDTTSEIPKEALWRTLPIDPQSICPEAAECMGFTQIFHASDQRLKTIPWHDITLPTAALGDSFFQQKWELRRKVWIDADCLHLGEVAKNWCGRVSPYRNGSLPPEATIKISEVEELKRRLWPS